METEQSRHDGRLFYRFEPRREHIKEKAGRHIDDFLVAKPERSKHVTHSTRNGERQSKPHTRNHQRESTGRR